MCHFGTNGIDFVFLKDVLPQMGFVTMFHRGDILHADEVGPEVYDRLREKGDVFLAIGETWHRRKLRQIGFDNTKIVSLPIGVDLRQIPYRPRTQAGADLDILTVARLEREKGLDVGLQAVKNLISTNPTTRIRYRIVGEGSERRNLTAQIGRLGLATIVELLGAQPTTEVVRWMNASHVFMLPSRTEGTPTVLLEAQASGMPVLATDVGGVVDIVGDGRSGFVVASEDANALTERLQYLLDHPAAWPTMGRQGRDFVEDHHDIAKLGRRLAALFETVTSDLRASRGSGSTSVSLADSGAGLPRGER
jgi:colanic acid/amylovoran biosynthesis glycosyltransferase